MSLQELFRLDKQDLEACTLQTLQLIKTLDKDSFSKTTSQTPYFACLFALFVEAARSDDSKEHFAERCHTYTDDNEKIQPLWDCLDTNRELFKSILCSHGNQRTLSSVDWRLEYEIASKSINEVSSPSYLMKMNFSHGNKTEDLVFSSDIPNLRHAIDSLECALKAGKTTYLKKKNALP